MGRGLVFVVLAGCHVKFPEQAPGLKITEPEFGRTHSKKTVSNIVPFDLDRDGSNGTTIVTNYLDRVASVGVRYVSELALVLEFTYKGHLMECVSRVVLDDGKSQPAPTVAPPPPVDDGEYTTTVTPWRPPEIRAQVTDREIHCEIHNQLATRLETTHESANDVTQKRPYQERWVPVEEVETLETREDCSLVPTRHVVKRYAHFVAMRFMPPDWAAIAKKYADGKLVELPPECHELAGRPTAHLKQSIRATLHYTGEMGREKHPHADTRPDDNFVHCSGQC